jgi:pantothenate synthetase
MDIQVLRSVAEIRRLRRELRDVKLGFVPTMGALHDGHLGIGMLFARQTRVPHVYFQSSFVQPNESAFARKCKVSRRSLKQCDKP